MTASSTSSLASSLEGKSVLVLGGSVFVGRHMVEGLLRRGADVAVLNRGATPSDLPDHVERLVADRTDAEQMRTALAGREWDAVFDVSGFVMVAGGSDIDGLLTLLDGQVGSYVYTSSIMAYDQSWVGVFPWTEEQPRNPDGPSSYGGFKALAEQSILARHHQTGFPGSVARPAAIYGPDNNIYDMEFPMFLRLLQNRPILVPHDGLIVGSYGHVDDLCDAMITMSVTPAANGEVFNLSGDSVDTNRYIAVLADVVGAAPNIVYVPDSLVAELNEPNAPSVYGHLFRRRHHAMLSSAKAHRVLGFRPKYDLESGHRQTYEWFCSNGFQNTDGPLRDPVWKSSWDFDAEDAIAARVTAR